MKKYIVLSALLCVIGGITTAQIPITLKAAIDTALKNNLLVKNEQLKATYQKMLINTAAVIPQATLFVEGGQINSSYSDTKFGITQTFSFPKVYTKQKELLQQEWKSSVLNVAVKEAFLKKQVAQVFYILLYVQQKRGLLQYADSLYAAFYKKAALRVAKGESNILEKASAETQTGQINQQLNQLQDDINIVQLQFQLLLNTTTKFIPETTIYKLQLGADTAKAILADHPTIKIIQQQQQIASAALQLEKSRLLPDLSFAYNNTSIKGFGADEKYYSAAKRFNAVQIGVGIPIFAKAQKSKINSAKIYQEVAANNYAAGVQTLQVEYEVALTQYKKYAASAQYFENSALKNATVIATTANIQLANGNINYLEWIQLINQVTTVKSDYIETVKNLNDAILQLNYFTNQ